MKKILKEYKCNSDMQFFEMVSNYLKSENIGYGFSLFAIMPKSKKLDFLHSATIGGWASGLNTHTISHLFKLV